MSNIISRIEDDIDDYIYLCRKYGEKPETSVLSNGYTEINPYSQHCDTLKTRNNREMAQHT